MPAVTRLSSEKLSSPFSCSQSPPLSGSKAMPKLFRWPYENSFCTFAPASPPIAAPAAKNGLSEGAAQMRVVWRRAAELIVRRRRVWRAPGVVDRSAPEILQVAAPPEIADED